MAINQNISAARRGMNRDAHPAELQQEEYSLALNSNIQNGFGDTALLQNEPSNIKCTFFKAGFKVIGHKFDNTDDKTYFFLVNPTTGCSEIGYIDTFTALEGLEPLAKVCKCHVTAVPDTPLEDINQEWTCEYHTILSDFCASTGECTGCLNFSIDHPIKESNISIKVEKTGRVLYWTDNFNPQRHLQLDDLAQYTTSTDDCEGTSVTTCLQCDKLRIFKEFKKPCLRPIILENGGALQAGTIEVLVAYSNATGTAISNYYALTNPIIIYDENNNVLDQTSLDYQTNKAVRIAVEMTDNAYDFFKITVIYRSGLDGAQRIYDYGVYPIDTKEVVISSLKNKSEVKDEIGNTALQNILARKTFYLKSKGMTAVNGYLFQYGMTGHREINLQKVVNLMGGFIQWSTVRADEDLYKNGVFISNYKGYLRDEVYPLGIKFFSDGGYETSLFPFVPRPPKASEIHILGSEDFPENTNTQSIGQFSLNCEGVGRDRRWQYENTATYKAIWECPAPEGSEIVTVRQEEMSCIVTDTTGDIQVLDEIVSSFITIPEETTLSIVEYVNQNAEEIINSTGANGADIRGILSNPANYPEACEPDFGDNCTHSTLVSEEMFAISSGSDVVTKEANAISTYTKTPGPTGCTSYVLDENGNKEEDTTFMSIYLAPGEVTYQRNIVPQNSMCTVALAVPQLTNPIIENRTYITNVGGDTEADLQTTTPVTTTSSKFTGFVHKGAIWFKTNFGGEQSTILELTHNYCNVTDSNTDNEVRLSFFDGCGGAYIGGKIITNVSQINDDEKLTTLYLDEFPSGTAYIAIDAPIKEQVNGKFTITPPCGCFSIYKRDVEYTTKLAYNNLTFGKKQTYKADCEYTVLKFDNCDPVPYKYGDFSYWESTETYPCNNEVWDSSDLVIKPADIPDNIQIDFETYYTNGLDANGNYVLTDATNLMDKPIRHYKFPDNSLIPFISESGEEQPGDFMNSVIAPIGFFLSNDVINAFLDLAVTNGILSPQERASITSYEIFRGDRSTNRSIIAKGLLFDMYAYTDKYSQAQVLYPNYPLNTLGSNLINSVPNHRFNNLGNNLFTFHSPDTHFYKPTLYREMNVEGYMFGKAGVYLDEVRDHALFTILGPGAHALSATLATAEVAFEVLLQSADWTLTATSAGNLATAAVSGIAAAAFIVTLGTQAFLKFAEYRYRWEKTFLEIGKPKNFAYYSVAVGHYNYFMPNSITNSRLRGLVAATYLKQGRWNVVNELNSTTYDVNNFQREDSVYLNLGESAFNVLYPTAYRDYDNLDTNAPYASRALWDGIGKSPRFTKNAASPYVSLKQFTPSQYGQIHDIEWVHTGYCGYLTESNVCETIFGGDIFISRFALKRKFPFFTNTAHGMGPLTPFKYSDYFNVNPGVGINSGNRFYVDHLLDEETFQSFGNIYPNNDSKYTLYSGSSNGFYIKPPAKFFLYSYGIPYFLVESEINVNLRYAKKEKHENFYPNITDVIEFTQESNVSIKEPNTFFYNFVYSQRPTNYPWWLLPTNFSQVTWDRINNLTNTLIYSRQDNLETNLSDPWLIYRPLDAVEFPSFYGKLIDVSGIESEQILARFENGFSVHNTLDLLAERITPQTNTIGTGGIFAGRALSFNKTDLGYGGTQHTAKVSCEFGHFWVDAKRGGVFQIAANAQGFNEITNGVQNWFKENLPFQIIKEFPDVDIDNAYNGIGLSMGWDNRLKRVFITKIDYRSKGQVCYSNGKFHSTKDVENIKEQYINQGYTYDGMENCALFFISEENNVTVTLPEVQLTDADYFDGHSWTIGYSPLVQSWISYYSFKPNYYINYVDYFQTGINSSADSSEIGLWSHFATTSSYNVFYGKLYPWIIEYPQLTKLTNSQLISVNYWLEVKKLYNKYDAADIVGVGFNKAWVYNNQQNTGDIDLVYHERNNRRLSLQYPQHNSTSISILQTEVNGEWNFNYLYNNIRNERNHLPVWQFDTVQIDRFINHPLMDYANRFKDRMRGDYFLVRLRQDVESRYKMLFRFATDTRDYKTY